MRGQFTRRDGLILPNNISKAGAKMILSAAFRNDVPTFYAGLVKGTPSLTMTMASMTEPTIGINGYARISIPRNSTGWPTENEVGGERFIETDWLTFAAVGGDFDKTIQRIALLSSAAYDSADDVLALSAALPTELQITPTTPLVNRQFKYAVFI